MKAPGILTMRRLPGTDGGDVEAVSIRSVTHAVGRLRSGMAVTAAGDGGALAVWQGDNGKWHCEAMRHKRTLELKKFKHLSAAVQWLKEWLPKIKEVRQCSPTSP